MRTTTVTLTLPDDLARELTMLPDANQFATAAIAEALRRRGETSLLHLTSGEQTIGEALGHLIGRHRSAPRPDGRPWSHVEGFERFMR